MKKINVDSDYFERYANLIDFQFKMDKQWFRIEREIVYGSIWSNLGFKVGDIVVNYRVADHRYSSVEDCRIDMMMKHIYSFLIFSN